MVAATLPKAPELDKEDATKRIAEFTELTAEVTRTLHAESAESIKIGKLLSQLKAGDLWKESNQPTWAKFLKARFDLSRGYAFRVMGAALLEPKLPKLPKGQHWTERTIRPLTQIKTDDGELDVARAIRVATAAIKAGFSTRIITNAVNKELGIEPAPIKGKASGKSLASLAPARFDTLTVTVEAFKKYATDDAKAFQKYFRENNKLAEQYKALAKNLILLIDGVVS